MIPEGTSIVFDWIYLVTQQLRSEMIFDNLRRCDLEDCFKSLKLAGINSLLVEGGANIIQSVLESNLANQVVVTIRPSFLGGYRSLTRELPQPLNLLHPAAASVGGDIVIYGQLDKSNVSSVDRVSACSADYSQETCDGTFSREPLEFINK